MLKKPPSNPNARIVSTVFARSVSAVSASTRDGVEKLSMTRVPGNVFVSVIAQI